LVITVVKNPKILRKNNKKGITLPIYPLQEACSKANGYIAHSEITTVKSETTFQTRTA